MPNFDIIIDVQDGRAIGQIRQVDRELKRTEGSANRTRSALRGIFSGLAVGQALRTFLDLSNASVSIENRLKLVEEQVGDTSIAFERLRQISLDTRSPLEENTALFQRAAQAQRELGASAEDLFTFVQATGTALAIQGGAANTARGALIQLSQSIGATIVRAEEFNSILEGALPLAQAAARGIDEAGGSVAKLRQLVIEGEISSREFFQAIISQQQELADLFARTNPTIAQAFTNLRTEAITLFREFDAATGISTTLAEALLFVANNLETIARIGIAASFALLIPIISAVTSAFLALTAAILLNPFAALAAVIGVAIGSLIAFGDQIRIFGDNTGRVIDFVIVTFQRLTQFISRAFSGLFPNIKRVFLDPLGDVNFGDLVKATAVVIDRVIALFAAGSATIAAIFQNLGPLIVAALLEAFLTAAEGLQGLINVAIDGLNLLGANIDRLDALGSIREGIRSNSKAVGAEIAAAFDTGFSESLAQGRAQQVAGELLDAAQTRRDLIDEDAVFSVPVEPNSVSTLADATKGMGDLADATDGAGNSAAGTSANFQKLFSDLEKQADALTRLGIEQDIYNKQQEFAEELGRNLNATEARLVDQQIRKIEVLQTASDIYDNLNDRTREYLNTQQAVQQLLNSGAINESEAAQAIADTSLVGDLRQQDQELGGLSAYQSQLDELDAFVAQRTNLLNQAREVDLINEEAYQQRLADITRQRTAELVDIEASRWELGLSSAQSSLGSILNLLKQQGQEQSSEYKKLFKLQKALAVAEATVNTARAVTNALAAPFPPPIPQGLAVAAAVAGGAEIAAILATNVQGLRDGGMVRGPGGPRDDAAGLFALSNGEMVINAAAVAANRPLLEAINRGTNIQGLQDGGFIGTNTAGPQLTSAGAGEASNAAAANRNSSDEPTNMRPVEVITVVVANKEEAEAFVASRRGQDSIIEVIEGNKEEIRSLLS